MLERTMEMVMMVIKWTAFSVLKHISNLINYFLIKCFCQTKDSSSTATVYTIKFRYKPSPLMPANPSSFLTIVEKVVDPEIVLSDNITLFNVRPEEAYFIDAGGEDVFDSSHNAFVYNSQFKLATKLIHLPLDSFHAIASKISLPDVPTIHLPNHGRCGSTLLTKMIEAVPNSWSISETMAFTDIAFMIQKGEIDQEKAKKLIHAAFLCTLKHASSRNSKLVFIKMQHFATYITDLMLEVVPSVCHVYMYRQPVPFVRSWEKLLFASGWNPGDDLWRTLLEGMECYQIMEDYPKYDFSRIKDLPLFGKMGMIWITCIAAFNKLVNKGYSMKSLKYEDLMVDPKLTMLNLFEYLGLEEDLLPDIDAVMAQDSQKDSDFTSRHVDKKVLEAAMVPLTDNLKKEVDMVCRDFGVPSFWDEIRLQNSILD